MSPTLAARRDKEGHGAWLAALAAAACLLIPSLAPAAGHGAGADEQPGTAFAAFVGSVAASTSSSAGGGGGAAGGGGSGAG